MYDVNDTIVAVSSPTSEARVIVRITGPDTIKVCQQIFHPQAALEISTQPSCPMGRGESVVLSGHLGIDAELSVDAQLYLFFAPHSYTADHVAEIHICTNSSVTEALMSNLLGRGLRVAGPGEFTARAYLNGKIDLAQAEAVNEVVVSSNTFQLAAAEKLLSGRLAETTEKVRSEMMDCLSLIEAGLDFSGEDIRFISRQEAVERLTEIRRALEQLLCSSIRYESVVDLPAVGIAGAPNAGKSSLLNDLLGADRSIVSAKRKTTRDVLTGLLTLAHCRCVLFDCAGLTPEPRTILDELAHEAAIDALRGSSVVVFCVDISKADWSEDLDVRSWILDARRASRIPPGCLPAEHRGSSVVLVATKSDLLSDVVLAQRLTELNGLFGTAFLATSVRTGRGIGLLRETMDREIVELGLGSAVGPFLECAGEAIAATARHRRVVTEAIENISESINELSSGPPWRDEVVAMMLRAAYQGICDIESSDRRIDEQVLEKIFSRFCIGK
jgi:tRNA modification GTPase